MFGILNPASGPGEVTDTSYPDVIDYVKGAGAKVMIEISYAYDDLQVTLVRDVVVRI